MNLIKYLSIILILIAITAQQEQSIEQQQQQQHYELIELNTMNTVKYVNKSKFIQLECPKKLLEASNNIKQSNYIIKWFKNNEKLKLFNKNKHKLIDNTLVIKSFNIYDIGVYKCLLITGNGINKLFNVTLKLAEIEGQNNNNNNNINNGDYNDDFANEDDDDTNYDYNQNGEAPRFIDVDTFVVKNFNKLAYSSIELNCNARGLPIPDIIWLKNNAVISEEDIGNARNSMILKIKNLNLNDNGNYTCQLTNEYGKINRTFSVNIYDNLIFNGIEPTNQTTYYGLNVKFKCEFANNQINQNTQIMWLMHIDNINNKYQMISNSSVEINGEIFVHLNNIDSKNKHIEINNNYLTINQVTFNDIGYYLCIINNTKGYNYRKAYLNVLPPPQPSIMQSSKDSSLIIPIEQQTSLISDKDLINFYLGNKSSIMMATLLPEQVSVSPTNMFTQQSNMSVTVLMIAFISIIIIIILFIIMYVYKNRVTPSNSVSTNTVRHHRQTNKSKLIYKQPTLLHQQQQDNQKLLLPPPPVPAPQSATIINIPQNIPIQQQQIQYYYQVQSSKFNKILPPPQQHQYNVNSLHKSITSQRSSNANNTTANTNTNSTTTTAVATTLPNAQIIDLNQPKYTNTTTSTASNNLIEQKSNWKYQLCNCSNNTAMLANCKPPNAHYDNYVNNNNQYQQHNEIFLLNQNSTEYEDNDHVHNYDDDDDDDIISFSDSSSNFSRPYAKIQFIQ